LVFRVTMQRFRARVESDRIIGMAVKTLSGWASGLVFVKSLRPVRHIISLPAKTNAATAGRQPRHANNRQAMTPTAAA